MKNLFLILLLTLNVNFVFANGVCVVDASQGKYLKLLTSQVNVNVDNQVAIIKATNEFINETDSAVSFKYAFPLPEDASAIGLRWFIDGKWNEAVISSSPQDTTLPGGEISIDYSLSQFLGSTPLFFDINSKIKPDSTIIIELTYVQFLKYEFGNVNFSYPNDYTLIQSSPLNIQELNFNLSSSRTIETIQLLSHDPNNINNSGYSALINFNINEAQADKDYKVLYSLSTDELGLFGFSTLQPDSLVPDQYSKGYFLFVAEPNPNQNVGVINKVFTLIIDRSGSMMGSKIEQAKNAADFIVNNLNMGDKFNIVDFSDNISSFRSSHVDFNEENKNAALAYISTLNADGLTNISGAFDTAIPQFINSNDSTANIIIFLTDGLPTAGITETNSLLDHIHNLVVQAETGVTIFAFGIGNDVNKQLLTLLASQNKGLSQFLGEDQLEKVITNFYLQIRNPVLLNTQIAYYPNV
jgi:Ca-activated chloride channel homolog